MRSFNGMLISRDINKVSNTNKINVNFHDLAFDIVLLCLYELHSYREMQISAR